MDDHDYYGQEQDSGRGGYSDNYYDEDDQDYTLTTEKEGGDAAFKVDYQKAIQNLTDILIDNDKFQEMCKNIFDAIDTDNVGTLEVSQVEQFVRSFLRGNQVPGQINTSFEDSHNQIFKILKDNESGEIT